MIHARNKSVHFPQKSYFSASIILWLALPCLSSLSLIQVPKSTALHFWQQSVVPLALFYNSYAHPISSKWNSSLHHNPSGNLYHQDFFPSIVVFVVQSVKETFPKTDPIVSPWEILWWRPTHLPAPIFLIVNFFILFSLLQLICNSYVKNLYTADDKYSILLKPMWICHYFFWLEN